jgi:hypothetical protein
MSAVNSDEFSGFVDELLVDTPPTDTVGRRIRPGIMERPKPTAILEGLK